MEFDSESLADSAGVAAAAAAPSPQRIDHRTGKPVLFHDPAWWAGHIERQCASGLTLATYCDQQGLAKSTFRRWAQRLHGERPAPAAGSARFVEVPIRPDGAAHGSAAAGAIEVIAAPGVRIVLSGKAAAGVLGSIVARIQRAAAGAGGAA